MPKVIPVKTKKTRSVKKTEIKADVYNIKGEKTGKISLPENIFGVKVAPSLIAQAVRVYQVNQRSGTRKAKTRGDVHGSSRKIYKQKGTGRARHGNIRAPIFVGGGVAHGPKIYDFHLNMSKKMRKLALFGALTEKFNEEKIKFISNMDKFPAKTKKMAEFLKNLKLIGNKIRSAPTLLVTEKVDQDILLATRNIPYLSIIPVSQLNTYQVLQNQHLLFVKNALSHFIKEKEVPPKLYPAKGGKKAAATIKKEAKKKL